MKLLYSVLLCLGANILLGQSLERQVIASYGNYSESSSISLSATAGEVATATFEQADIVLTQGFQQPSEKDPGIGIERIFQSLNIRAFPNPTSQKIILELNSDKQVEIFVRLFDMTGKQLQTGAEKLNILGRNIHEIDLEKYASGQYIIQLSDQESKKIESIKVLKTN